MTSGLCSVRRRICCRWWSAVWLSATSTQVCGAHYELLVNCSEHHLCDSWQNLLLITALPEGQGIRWKRRCLHTVTTVAAGTQQCAATHWTTKAVQRAVRMASQPVLLTLSSSRQKAALVLTVTRNRSLVWTAEATMGRGRLHNNEEVEMV